jgi:hypothetical protein
MTSKVKTVKASKVAQAYDQKRNGAAGRFAKLNPCYGCGKSAGKDYYSHPLTDNGWGDMALVLCEKCGSATQHMWHPLDFIAYAEAHGGMTSEIAASLRQYRSERWTDQDARDAQQAIAWYLAKGLPALKEAR